MTVSEGNGGTWRLHTGTRTQLRLLFLHRLHAFHVCFLPFARYAAGDVGSCFQRSLHGVRGSKTCTSVHRRPRRQLCLSGFQRAPVPTQPNVCWEVMTNIIDVFRFFFILVLVLSHLRRSRILSVSRKRDERGRRVKVPNTKQRRQKEKINTGCKFLTFSAAAFIRLAAEIFMEVSRRPGTSGKMVGIITAPFLYYRRTAGDVQLLASKRCHTSWHQNQKVFRYFPEPHRRVKASHHGQDETTERKVKVEIKTSNWRRGFTSQPSPSWREKRRRGGGREAHTSTPLKPVWSSGWNDRNTSNLYTGLFTGRTLIRGTPKQEKRPHVWKKGKKRGNVSFLQISEGLGPSTLTQDSPHVGDR